MGLEIAPTTIKFFQRKGVQYFKDFEALDKFKRPIRLSFAVGNETSTINAFNEKGSKLGFYELEFHKDKSFMKGVQLISFEENQHVAEVLTLSALMEFLKNGLNHFKLKSFAETIAFHARYGFIVDTKDTAFILNGLRSIQKSKAPYIDTHKVNAKLFYPKIENKEIFKENEDNLAFFSCKVICDFLKYLSLNKLKKYIPEMWSAADMDFSDWEVLTNRMNLNPMMEKHGIDFRF